MHTLLDAQTRHANCYLHLAESAADLFFHEAKQVKGIAIFDQNREQIETALKWMEQLEETGTRDLALASFIDSLSAIGMLRYSIRDRLIPMVEQKIAAAQRLEMKDMEADAYDDLGIKYAYLGDLRQAIDFFEVARTIAIQTSDTKLLKNIKSHINQARSQLKNKIRLPSLLIDLVKLPLLFLKLQIARFRANPFVEVPVLNKIADIYMEWNKFDVAAKLFSRAITLAKENDYRLGQLDASLGLLHVEIMKQGEVAKLSMALQVVDQGNGFEWNNDLLFFQTMLEIQPAIDTAELMARSLISKNRECAEEIYRLLDLIFAEVDVAHVAIQERSDQKPEILVASLTIIKDGLAQIIRLYSSQKAGENADQS